MRHPHTDSEWEAFWNAVTEIKVVDNFTNIYFRSALFLKQPTDPWFIQGSSYDKFKARIREIIKANGDFQDEIPNLRGTPPYDTAYIVWNTKTLSLEICPWRSQYIGGRNKDNTQVVRIQFQANQQAAPQSATDVASAHPVTRAKTATWMGGDLDKYPNQILCGPPGTGKTHHALYLAKETLKLPHHKEWQKNVKEERKTGYYELVQFHPAMTYEDFVRGMVSQAAGGFKAEHKVFSRMCADAAKLPEQPFLLIIDEINRANLPAVLGECIFALEYRKPKDGGKDGFDRSIVTTPYAVEESKHKSANPDEPAKDVKPPESTPDKGDATLSVPENLIVIGTMNTADRSTGLIDYAIRRRFVFVPCLPNIDEVYKDGQEAFTELMKLFYKDGIVENGEKSEFLAPDYEPNDVAIGHTYFLKPDTTRNETEETAKAAADANWTYKVKPMLEEYIKDGVFAEGKTSAIRNWLKESRSFDDLKAPADMSHQ